MSTINTDYAREKLATFGFAMPQANARATHEIQQQVRTDAYWRIVSNAELLAADLDPEGMLTLEQYAAVEWHVRETGVEV